MNEAPNASDAEVFSLILAAAANADLSDEEVGKIVRELALILRDMRAQQQR
jgi:hypothetical protein